MATFHDRVEAATTMVFKDQIPGILVASPPGTGKLHKVMETLNKLEADIFEVRLSHCDINKYFAAPLDAEISHQRALGLTVIIDIDGANIKANEMQEFLSMMADTLVEYGGIIFLGKPSDNLPVRLLNRLVSITL